MTEGRQAYSDPRAPQQMYAGVRNEPYAYGLAGAPPRTSMDDPPVYNIPRPGQPIMAPPRPPDNRHARVDKSYGPYH
jgi:hypothetical protein